MKCPKCGYLGFEAVDRCRNCGYDFALAAAPPPSSELTIRSRASYDDSLPDLLLGTDSDQPSAGRASVPAPTPDLGGWQSGLAAGAPQELPLFGAPLADDAPLITRVSPPRTPLAVRRATPEVPRVRGELRPPLLDFLPAQVEPRPDAHAARPHGNGHGHHPAHDNAAASSVAGVAVRLGAGLIDLAILALIDSLVVYLTLQIVGLTLQDVSDVPLIPLLAFLTALKGAYFVAFTAVGGQTLGQMAASIKVTGEGGRVPDVGRAFVRTLVWGLLVLPAGLGLLTVLMSDDRRGFHDRIAGTRVVRAPV